MDEVAVVRQVLAGQVIVESKVKSTCSQCQQVDNCGSGIVAKAMPHKSLSVTIETSDTFNIGDEVIISIPENALLSVAWRVYLFPLMGLIIAGAFGQFLYTQVHFITAEWQAIILSFFGGYSGYRLAKWSQSNLSSDNLLVPTIKQRVIPLQVI